MTDYPAAPFSLDEAGPRLLQQERSRASFHIPTMELILAGSPRDLKTRKRMQELVANDPIFKPDDDAFLGRTGLFQKGMERALQFKETILGKGLNPVEAQVLRLTLSQPLPIDLNYVAFIPTIMGQGTQEQQDKWVADATLCRIIGAYCQTELGHGSNVQGLETTATFDAETDEFVIHSPTITSTKWWAGTLGKIATHAVVYARLLLPDKDYGIHPFVVPLRDPETHAIFPGITIGDIGPKFGLNTLDNGWMRFSHVRIPRFNMLARFAQVDRNGRYTKPPHAKLYYGSMVNLRAVFVIQASSTLGKAVTVATRYSCVRQQGGGAGRGEQQVMNYQVQQYRIIPLLATTYIFHFTGVYMKKMMQLFQKQLEEGDLSVLPEVHATSAGLKAICSWITADGVEDCRKCCGGHGFSSAAGLSTIFANYVPTCTFEGDNVVLSLQTASHLIKCLTTAESRQPVSGNAAYFNRHLSTPRLPAHSPADLLDPQVQLTAFECRAVALTRVARDVLVASGVDINDKRGSNIAAIDLAAAARAHCFVVMVKAGADALETLRAKGTDSRILTVLKALFDLFALSWMEKDSGQFNLIPNFIDSEQLGWVRQHVRALLAQLRPDAVALVDALGFADCELNSQLGRQDGQVYRGLCDFAEREPLNNADKDLFYPVLRKIMGRDAPMSKL